MTKYICPLCGKTYYDAKTMAGCAMKCANRIEDEKNKNEAEKAAILKELNEKKNEIKKDFNSLLTKVRDYNSLGTKLNALDNKTAAQCTASLDFSNNANPFINTKNISKTEKDEIIAELDKIRDKTLDELITSIFGF